jgi:hypothetical protein
MPRTNFDSTPEGLEHAVDLRAAAVDDHRVHPDVLEQHDVLGERLLELVVRHRVAAVLDDDRLAEEAAQVGQGLSNISAFSMRSFMATGAYHTSAGGHDARRAGRVGGSSSTGVTREGQGMTGWWGLRAVIVVAMIGALGGHAATGDTPDRCGDANDDGRVSLSDGVQALRTAVGLGSTCNDFRCDVDGSGAVTLTDGIGVLRRAAELPAIDTYGCPVPSATHHLSGFSHFRLQRQNGLGFCPVPGSVLDVEIDRQADGTYRLQLSVAEERPAGDPACVYPELSSNGSCIAGSQRPDRTLTDDELKAVRKAFGTLQVFAAPLAICEIAFFDPCVINRLEWDAVSADDYPCTAPRIEPATVEAISDVLDGLIASETP